MVRSDSTAGTPCSVPYWMIARSTTGSLFRTRSQRLQRVDQSERSEITEGAVVDELDQVLHGDVEGVHRGLQRGRCGLVGGGLDHEISLVEHAFDNKDPMPVFPSR